MEQYMEQLIEDIQAARRTEFEEVVEEDFSLETHFAEVERFVSGEGHRPLKEILGLDEEQFPPVSRLTDDMMSRVSEAFIECLSTWNILVDIPENLPITLKYTLLIPKLQSEVFIQNSGFIHLEFCDYNTEQCRLGPEFCQCKDLEFDSMSDFEPNEGELPF